MMARKYHWGHNIEQETILPFSGSTVVCNLLYSDGYMTWMCSQIDTG